MKTMLLAFAAVAAFAVVPANAVTITTLYNTGVAADGTIAVGNGADVHWMLNDGAVFTGGTNGNFPIGPWLADDTNSRWLTPSANAADSFDATTDGLYTYSETFSLAGINAATASFTGRFAVDNSVDTILLNGVALAGSGGTFTGFTSFSSAGGTFNAGNNTLTFIVRNFASASGNPTGLRVEVAGVGDPISAIPEPSTWAMLVMGMGLTGFAARRRKAALAS